MRQRNKANVLSSLIVQVKAKSKHNRKVAKGLPFLTKWSNIETSLKVCAWTSTHLHTHILGFLFDCCANHNKKEVIVTPSNFANSKFMFNVILVYLIIWLIWMSWGVVWISYVWLLDVDVRLCKVWLNYVEIVRFQCLPKHVSVKPWFRC